MGFFIECEWPNSNIEFVSNLRLFYYPHIKTWCIASRTVIEKEKRYDRHQSTGNFCIYINRSGCKFKTPRLLRQLPCLKSYNLSKRKYPERVSDTYWYLTHNRSWTYFHKYDSDNKPHISKYVIFLWLPSWFPTWFKVNYCNFIAVCNIQPTEISLYEHMLKFVSSKSLGFWTSLIRHTMNVTNSIQYFKHRSKFRFRIVYLLQSTQMSAYVVGLE